MDYQKIVCVQISACIAETLTYPIDYIKTLIQIGQKKTSFFEIGKTIVNKDKFQLYNGLKPSIMRHCIYTMSRINLYENLRSSDSNFFYKICIAGFCGGISQFIASPCDLLKIRYITNEKNTSSLYNNMKSIIHLHGISGMWKGVSPNVSRAVLVNCGELVSYDYSKNKIKKHTSLKEGTPLHIISSGISGFCATLCCTPADVIKSRFMQTNTPYKNVFDCIQKTYTNEGITAFYKGFTQIWFRLAPWQLTFWISYEKLRQILHIKEFD